ncbi:glycosyl hydrolase family 18 protein [Francisella adeliensis]|uniref:chitinase n=2 Tax=Francisella adeliensis TaxID=2007306 RepID=A0ABX6KD35_9GAMM|nr:glycosyl hydrolase family 18 protein [Francisella adeliensis]MBK2084703.1 hypothetical protein [Francisella adeliensis]MBK2096056.1 hypothetical protein [Francisella adeliensis]QIW12248.1 hypothetical protein FZC43_06110 [Francisella adeliensis]QIW14124.1 hypothetical protein FZC44_06110 [Francisella adeliensis]
MKSKYKLISAITLAFMGSIAYADCNLEEAKDGWTGSIRFKCDADTNLLDKPISFELSNGVQVGSVWGLPGKTNVIKNGNKVTVTVEKWWPQDQGYVLPAGKSTVVSFSPLNVATYDANYAPDFEIRNFDVGNGSQEQQIGEFTISTGENPQGVDSNSTPHIIIYNDNGAKVEDFNLDWNSSITKQLTVGKYTVFAEDIGSSKAYVSPANFTVAQNDSVNLDVNYSAPAPAEVGSISLTADIAINSTQKPAYTIKSESDANFIRQGTISLNNATVINDLPEGKYIISVADMSADGAIFKANPISTNVTKFNTTDVNLEFIKQEVATQTVTINVKGLPNEQTAILTLMNDNNDSQEITLDSNNTFEIDIPKDNSTWTATVTKPNGYKATLSTSSFSADNDSQNIEIQFEQRAPIESGKKVVGYWANWKGAMQSSSTNMAESQYYTNDVAPYTHVLYSFLTLAKNPNPDNPSNTEWDGTAIYESMTAKDVLGLMKVYPEGTAGWEREDNWMRSRVDGLIEATHKTDGKFIWALGGWSDLQQTISPAQVDKLVDMMVQLLKQSGDGIDFDWEHINQLANGQPNPNAKEEQAVLAETMLKLRQKLDAAGMQDKEIGYTTRFNAFMTDSKKYGFAGFKSDGEGIAIDNWLKANGSSLNKVVNWVNIMAYDVGPSYMPNGKTWNMDVYKDVLDTFKARVNPELIVLGFEPGFQAAGGVWEGMDVSKQAVNYVAENNYGGSMFWAINLPNPAVDGSKLGLNSDILADYSKEKFEIE